MCITPISLLAPLKYMEICSSQQIQLTLDFLYMDGCKHDSQFCCLFSQHTSNWSFMTNFLVLYFSPFLHGRLFIFEIQSFHQLRIFILRVINILKCFSQHNSSNVFSRIFYFIKQEINLSLIFLFDVYNDTTNLKTALESDLSLDVCDILIQLMCSVYTTLVSSLHITHIGQPLNKGLDISDKLIHHLRVGVPPSTFVLEDSVDGDFF